MLSAGTRRVRSRRGWRCGLLALGSCWLVAAVARAEPPPLWTLPLPGDRPMAIVRDQRADSPYLYLANKDQGLLVLELVGDGADGAAVVASLPISTWNGLHAMHLFQSSQTPGVLFLALGDHFALAGSGAGVVAIDISEPTAPAFLHDYYAPGAGCGSTTVIERDGIVYLAVMGQGLESLAFAADRFAPLDAIVPGGESSCDFAEAQVRGLALQGDRLYVGNDGGGLVLIDVSNPSDLREVTRYLNDALGRKPLPYNHVVVAGDHVYAAVDYCGLEVIDVGDEDAIVQADWWNPWQCQSGANWWLNSPGHLNQIEYDPEKQRVISSAGDSEVVILDVSDPARVRLIGQVGASGNGEGTWGAHVDLDREILYATYIENTWPFASQLSAVRAYAVPEPRLAPLLVAGGPLLAALSRAFGARARRRDGQAAPRQSARVAPTRSPRRSTTR